jgi:long-chain acyl-CoA synthetase
VSRTHLSGYLNNFLRRGEEVAFVHTEGYRTTKWSYRKVAECASGLAHELARRGIGRGDRVILWAPASPEWVAAFFGCLLRGAVVVPLDLQCTPDFLLRTARQVSARLAMADAARLAAFPTEIPVLALELTGSLRRPLESPPAGLSSQDIAEIIYTSGTTAEPKGVVLTHSNLLVSLVNIEKEIGKYRHYERPFHPIRFLCTLPLSHVFGQMMGMLVPQLLGGEVHFHDALLPARMIDVVRERRISVLATVPRIIELLRGEVESELARSGKTEEFHRSFEAAASVHFLKRWWMFREVHRRFGWKFWAMISGGATLAGESERFWQRLGYAVIQGYGMTETASLVSLNHPFKLGRGSIGKVMPGREIRLSDSGEILVRGENVSPGYWKESGRIEAERDAGGWLRTGDLAEMDAAGNLYFKGRTKEVIVTASGMNVYPDDLESALNAQPEVHASTVVAADGPQGPEPVAVLILKSGASGDGVLQRANQSLAAHQQMCRWVHWKDRDFPRTSTGKIIRRAVLDGVRPHLDNAKPAAAGAGSLHAIVARLSGQAPERMDRGANLTTDLHLDSLGRMQLLAEIEELYQVSIDESRINAATTLGDIEDLLEVPATQAAAAPQEPHAAPVPPLEHAYPDWPLAWPVRAFRWAWLQLIAMPAVVLMAHPRVEGARQLKTLRKPLLFASNHQTEADAGLIIYGLPYRLRWRLAIAMSGELLTAMRVPPASLPWYERWYEQLCYYLVVSIFNVFPLPQKSGFRQSFAHAGSLMDRGFSVLVFPEGRRARDECLQPLQSGAGLLVEGLRCPVVPVYIRGLASMRNQQRKFARFGEVVVRFGEPREFPPGTPAQEITALIERAMQRLAQQPR